MMDVGGFVDLELYRRGSGDRTTVVSCFSYLRSHLPRYHVAPASPYSTLLPLLSFEASVLYTLFSPLFWVIGANNQNSSSFDSNSGLTTD